MNALKGPFRLMFEDMRIQFYILTGITVALWLFFLVLGMSVDTFMGTLFGPYYGLFAIYPFLVYNKGYVYTLALGGTRKQFLFSMLAASGLFIVICMAVLNGIYQLNAFLLNQGIINIPLFHMGELVGSANPLLYFWVDLLWCVFLFGVSFGINSVWFYFGTVRFLLGLTGVALVVIAYLAFADLRTLFTWIVENHLVFLHVMGAVGFAAAGLSYVIMKNGPLERGGERGLFFKNKTVQD